MAISTAMMSRDHYGMSSQEYYERRNYEEIQMQMMREAQMRQQINPFQQYQQEAQIQAPQENKTLLLL